MTTHNGRNSSLANGITGQVISGHFLDVIFTVIVELRNPLPFQNTRYSCSAGKYLLSSSPFPNSYDSPGFNVPQPPTGPGPLPKMIPESSSSFPSMTIVQLPSRVLMGFSESFRRMKVSITNGGWVSGESRRTSSPRIAAWSPPQLC